MVGLRSGLGHGRLLLCLVLMVQLQVVVAVVVVVPCLIVLVCERRLRRQIRLLVLIPQARVPM